ncbi:cytosolic sulfotransferase 15 [Eucalyptus grandis]|uniref:cytosolic sulfotransferase 15 n=1 Tax=Eucalyptus grandis TaxID=71139 RepID=UPI00192EE1CA|nr:cytosolic sulfotransferase 15 [Eucalyptus grandis]
MAHQQLSLQPAIVGSDEHDQEAIDELIASLPTGNGLVRPVHRLYQNFWCPPFMLPNVIAFQRHFKAKDKDIVLVSQPKAGTTWLKALAFSVINRSHFDISNTPLLTSNPHEVVPFIEHKLWPNLDGLAEPRLLRRTSLTHPCRRVSSGRIAESFTSVETHWTSWFPLGTS